MCSPSTKCVGHPALDLLLTSAPQCLIEVLFTSADLLPTVNKICKTCPSLKSIIYVDEAKDAVALVPSLRAVSWPELEARGRAAPVCAVPPAAESTAVIMYTSGSTGAPKGVIITHASICLPSISLTTHAHTTPTVMFV